MLWDIISQTFGFVLFIAICFLLISMGYVVRDIFLWFQNGFRNDGLLYPLIFKLAQIDAQHFLDQLPEEITKTDYEKLVNEYFVNLHGRWSWHFKGKFSNYHNDPYQTGWFRTFADADRTNFYTGNNAQEFALECYQYGWHEQKNKSL
jgi:hypothetical protein